MNAAAEQSGNVSGPVLLFVLISAGAVYLFGYLRAVMHRANRDYKSSKAAVKPMRKAFWTAWLAALRIGVLIVVGFVLLVAWFARDTRSAQSEEAPKPSPSVSAGKAHR